MTLRHMLALAAGAGLFVAAPARAGELPRWRPAEPVEERFALPSESNRHAELRVIRRDGARCVQTVIFSPLLARGLKKIRGKEFGAWPEGAAGHADSTNFVALLREAEAAVRTAFEAQPDKTDPRQKMLIEVVADAAGAEVAAYAIDLTDDQGTWTVTAARLLGARRVSAAYANRDMDLMIENARHPAAGDEAP